MADDYARHALSQRAAFEATYPAALAAAPRFADEPVLCVADLGAADGVNSHGLIRDLRGGARRPAADLCARRSADERVGGGRRPPAASVRQRGRARRSSSSPGPADGRLGARTSAAVSIRPRRRRTARPAAERSSAPAPGHGDQPGGHPLHEAPCLPPGTVHVAVSGTAMHWIAEAAGLASTGSVFPGYPDHTDEAERRAWGEAAARQWERLLEMRGHRARAGRPVDRRSPRLPAPGPERTGLYVEMIGDMNRILAEWCGAGRIGDATVAAAVVPVWMRHAGGDPGPVRGGRRALRRPRARERRALPSRQPLLGRRSGDVRARLRAERHRLGRAAPPTRVRARGRGPRPRAPRRVPRPSSRNASPLTRTVPPGLHRGPRHLPEVGGRRGGMSGR